MYKIFVMVGLALIGLAPSIVQATVLTGPITNPANGNTYYLLERTTWLESQVEAENLGGNLATIDDVAENNWVFDTFSSLIPNTWNLWIGLNDFDVEGQFEWVSGSSSTYRNFSTGQPDNYTAVDLNGEHFVSLFVPDGVTNRTPRAWNDVRIGGTNFGVVEVVVSGDGNGDGWVDGLDYLIWAENFGTHPGADGDISDGDYNDDGWVDGIDYLTWANNFGTHATTSVPEPGTLGLALLGLVGLFSVARRRRR